MNYTLLSCGGISKQGMPDSRQGLLKRITTAVSSLPVVLRFANRQSNLRGERRLLQLQLTRRPSEKFPAEATGSAGRPLQRTPPLATPRIIYRTTMQSFLNMFTNHTQKVVG